MADAMRDGMPDFVAWENRRKGRRAARRQYDDEDYVPPADARGLHKNEAFVTGQFSSDEHEDDQRPGSITRRKR